MISKSTRGSEWRKWDLHIHTPSSYDYKDKTITNEEFINKLVENNISAVAITDHHIIDIERIKKLQELGLDKDIIIFPGIELLSDARGSEPIHIIGIFSNTSKIDYIWSQLKAKTNICKIEGEGKKENEVYCDLTDTVKLIHDLGGIVTIHAGHKSNSMETIPHTIPHGDAQKNDIAGIVDIFEVAKEKDVADYKKYVNSAIKKSIDKELPIIICSDNHDIKNYELRQNCWIKANITFEGLKQIIYEPEDRVRVQADKPEQKNDYQIIDSIEFNNNAMGTQKIEFNQNLNTVIGGRSSGKSILLGCLANIIDPSQKPKENQDAYNENIRKLIKDASVLWRDGSSETRKIIYYSQSKISEIVRPDENGISGINKLVNRIVRTDENKVELLQAYDKAVIANRTELVSKINDFCEIKKQIQEKNDEIRDIGIKKGIQQEIEKLEKEIDSIKKELKDYLSASDEQLYKEKVEKLEKLQECRKLLTSDTAQYDIAENSELFTSLDSLLSSFSSLNHDEISDFYESLKKETKEKWVDFIKKQKKDVFEKMNKVDEKIKEITDSEIFIKGNSFKDNNEVLSKKDSDLQKEKQKNNTIEKIESEISKLQESLNNCKNDIFVSFSKYKTLANELSEKLQMQKKDVEIKSNVHLLYKDFFKLVLESINRTRKENQKYEDYETISPSSREELISNLFYGIINDEIILKKQFHQVLTDLFSNNYYTISYDVTYDNDSFEKMSEGKKAFIVLRLLLDFDDSVCPIIIDQPEDDLDNRAIYDQLVKYLKEQKKERQIILATHNPNVVVGADAELVIVANQNGIDSLNQDNLQFEYYGNSIEDTFENKDCDTILLSKGIREHICEILEGGNLAFQIREKKYGYRVH